MKKEISDKIKNILAWTFGIFLLLSGLSRFFQDPVAALILFVMSAMLIPPALKWVEENLKIKISRKMKIVVLVVGFFIVGSIAKPLGETETVSTDKSKEEVQEDKLSENETILEPEEEVVTLDEQLIPPDYEIAEVEDLSLPTANRYNIRVVLKNDPATRDQIKTASKEIVEDYKDRADAVSILFYYDTSQVEGAYTLAMVDWAPYGDWAQADLKKNQFFDYTYSDIVGQRRSEEVGSEDDVSEEIEIKEEEPTGEKEEASEIEPVVEAVKVPTPTPEPKEEAIQAKDLYNEYDNNEIAADEKYEGEEILITGTIQEIGKDIFDDMYVSLKTDNIIGTVQCMLADGETNKAAKLSTGQSITMSGESPDYLINVILRECVIE